MTTSTVVWQALDWTPAELEGSMTITSGNFPLGVLLTHERTGKMLLELDRHYELSIHIRTSVTPQSLLNPVASVKTYLKWIFCLTHFVELNKDVHLSLNWPSFYAQSFNTKADYSLLLLSTPLSSPSFSSPFPFPAFPAPSPQPSSKPRLMPYRFNSFEKGDGVSSRHW